MSRHPHHEYDHRADTGPPPQVRGQLTLFEPDCQRSADPPSPSPPSVDPTAGLLPFILGNREVFVRFTVYTWGSALLVGLLVIGAPQVDLPLSHLHLGPGWTAAGRAVVAAFLGVVARIYFTRLHERYRDRSGRQPHRARRWRRWLTGGRRSRS